MSENIDRLKQKPILFDAKVAHQENIISYTTDGSAIIKLGRSSTERKIPLSNQYDLTTATIFGLNERLTSSAISPVVNKDGLTLREEFNLEWQKYAEIIEQADENKIDYGVYAYYPEKNHLVKFCSSYWHRIVAVASNSMLYMDADKKKTWREIREVFANAVIGVVGCSVGSSIIHNLVLDMRPRDIKVADKSVFKMENINRVRLTYDEMVLNNESKKNICDLALKNKAVVIAEQLYAIDPYINVHVFAEGIYEENMLEFFDGCTGQPPLDMIIEGADDPKIKLFIREEARKRKIPLLMASDFGSTIQFDIRRFDLDQNLTLTHGISDHDLYEATAKYYDDASRRESFFNFVDSLVGCDYRQDELDLIINQKTEIPTSTIIPQLGSTAAAAGALMAEIVARIRLGYSYPPRFYFNKKNFEVKKII